MFGDNSMIDFGDVLQGISVIDDNYFLAGLASLVPYPSLMSKIIATTTYNTAGIFGA